MLKTDKLHGENSKQQVFIHSYIPDLSCIGENVIIEYSLLNVANAIGENCIISNCSFPEGISVPANTFLHTIPVSDFGSIYYVTLCFNINDDLKASVIDKEETSSLKIFGKPLSELVSLLQLTGVGICVCHFLPSFNLKSFCGELPKKIHDTFLFFSCN